MINAKDSGKLVFVANPLVQSVAVLRGHTRAPAGDAHLAESFQRHLGSVLLHASTDGNGTVTKLIAPDLDEVRNGAALNFVTLGPRHVLMADENPITQTRFEEAEITCRNVQVGELAKAAGAIGCLTGFLERELGG